MKGKSLLCFRLWQWIRLNTVASRSATESLCHVKLHVTRVSRMLSLPFVPFILVGMRSLKKKGVHVFTKPYTRKGHLLWNLFCFISRQFTLLDESDALWTKCRVTWLDTLLTNDAWRLPCLIVSTLWSCVPVLKVTLVKSFWTSSINPHSDRSQYWLSGKYYVKCRPSRSSSK
jgi:hypothetical protein